jgi:polysaccharide biosynthesis transport protein
MNSMVDNLDEESSEGFDLQRYLGIVRRRHLQFLIPLLLGWALVWGASWVLPPRYQSTTLILVEQATMPRDYVTPNVNDDLQQRMQSITQQILSRTRLLHIIDQLKLYAGPQSQASHDQEVDRMRKDIDIELVRDARNQITAFNVSYSSRDPHLAQQVTSELTNLFINENLETRQQ